ncbi:hypothetical protein FB45DRAFT_860124 [Roridomyces roridus]|uniref:Uncharacterized protein n=1 Tax=Roridomyces roridus TaxID=1738132 RepID=A0AAD7CE26_9AGAR|nr:hypothetical protein FB45DRAFT_860120 [Roridomyces roridus]KAJ7646650.1 hypothetical protein FB45DRAFT_860124 [Roridomyces roridus]
MSLYKLVLPGAGAGSTPSFSSTDGVAISGTSTRLTSELPLLLSPTFGPTDDDRGNARRHSACPHNLPSSLTPSSSFSPASPHSVWRDSGCRCMRIEVLRAQTPQRPQQYYAPFHSPSPHYWPPPPPPPAFTLPLPQPVFNPAYTNLDFRNSFASTFVPETPLTNSTNSTSTSRSRKRKDPPPLPSGSENEQPSNRRRSDTSAPAVYGAPPRSSTSSTFPRRQWMSCLIRAGLGTGMRWLMQLTMHLLLSHKSSLYEENSCSSISKSRTRSERRRRARNRCHRTSGGDNFLKETGSSRHLELMLHQLELCEARFAYQLETCFRRILGKFRVLSQGSYQPGRRLQGRGKRDQQQCQEMRFPRQTHVLNRFTQEGKTDLWGVEPNMPKLPSNASEREFCASGTCITTTTQNACAIQMG